MSRCIDCNRDYESYNYAGVMISLCRGCRDDRAPKPPNTMIYINGIYRPDADIRATEDYQVAYTAWRKRRGLDADE